MSQPYVLLAYKRETCHKALDKRLEATSLSSFSKAIHSLTTMITGNHVGKLFRQARDALTKKQKVPRLIRTGTQTCPLIELPNEIAFQFLEYMPLQSLISCRLVCSRWRHIVPLANLYPARQQLLQPAVSTQRCLLRQSLLRKYNSFKSKPLEQVTLEPYERDHAKVTGLSSSTTVLFRPIVHAMLHILFI